MPELPEVETTVRGMNKEVKGLAITDIWTDWPNTFHGYTAMEVADRICGTSFISITRRGKNILAELSSGYTLIMHMKMTGHYMVGAYIYNEEKNKWVAKDQTSPLSDPYNRFIHTAFSLSDGRTLVFCDARKFGSIELLQTSDIVHHKRLSCLGPEPLEKSFTYTLFKKQMRKKEKSKVKTALLDQSTLAGVGNIYTDEALHDSHIHPESIILHVPEEGLLTLHGSIQKILYLGLSSGGDSTSDYRNIYGARGGNQKTHKVYKRKGEHCLQANCGGTIERIVVGSRGTYFCKNCQKLHI